MKINRSTVRYGTVAMPRKGYRTITVKEDVYQLLGLFREKLEREEREKKGEKVKLSRNDALRYILTELLKEGEQR